LDHFYNDGFLLVEFTGGEAFLSPYLAKAVKYAKKLGYKIGISTNGINFNLIEQFKPGEIDKFTFSLDGIKAKTHNYLRGPNVYQKCLSTIKKTIKLGYKVDVVFTVHHFNIEEIPQTIKFLDDIGIHQLSFNFISNSGSASLHQQFLLPPKLWLKAKKLIKNNSKTKHLILRFPELFLTQKQFSEFRQQKPYFCRLLKPVKVELYPDGYFYHCCFVAHSKALAAGRVYSSKVKVNTTPEIEFANKYKDLTCPDYQTRGQIYAPSNNKLIPICLYYKTIIKPASN
jgi:MoaA/NifB/PqqE/SkfB family radical SAM enzyme